MACSANQEQVFSPLDQSGVSNFALGERKIKKKIALCFDLSAFSNFALSVISCFTRLIPADFLGNVRVHPDNNRFDFEFVLFYYSNRLIFRIPNSSCKMFEKRALINSLQI